MHVDKDSNVGFRDEEEREEDQITEGNFLIPVLNPQVCCLFNFRSPGFCISILLLGMISQYFLILAFEVKSV